MPFSRPTLSELVARIRGDIEANVEGADALLRRAFLSVLGKVVALAVHILYGFLELTANNIFVTTAVTDYLDLHGQEWGLPRLGASYAIGTATATGINGSVIPAATELQLSDGRVYIVQAAAVVAAGVATLSLKAELSGIDGNEDSGVVLTFISPIVGVDSTATLSAGGFDGGADEESDDEYRARILSRKRYPPHGGADFDFVAWIQAYSAAITRGWAIPEYQGAGTVGLAFVLDDQVGSILPSAALVAAVRAYLLQHTDSVTGRQVGAYVTAEPGMFFITLLEKAVNFSIRIYPNTTVVRAAVQAELEDLLRREGGPEQTVYLSRINEAISTAIGEQYHLLVSPVADVTAAVNEVLIMGTITWSDYS